MNRDEIERRAREWIVGAPAVSLVVDFVTSIHDAAKEEDASLVESKTLSRPNHLGAMGLVDRREGQPSMTAQMLATAIRASKVGE